MSMTNKRKPSPKKRKREIGCGCLSLFIYLIIAIAIVFAIVGVKKFVFDKETKLDIFRGENTEQGEDINAAEDGDELPVESEQIYDETEAATPQTNAQAETEAAIDISGVIEELEVDIYSRYAILTDITNNNIIAEKRASDIAYPASITKVMTAVVVLESLEDLHELILLDEEIYQYAAEQNATTSGYVAGEEVSAYELLYGMMLPSGADAALALAKRVAGSEAEFAELMNKKALEIGMKNSSFVNCTGLHDDDHYSTAYDLSLLVRYALKNDTFRAIFTSKSHASTGTVIHPDGITVRSTVFNAIRGAGYGDEYIIGGKTGYTLEAGRCLASLVRRGETEYVLITLDAGSDYTFPIVDAYSILDYYISE